MAELVDAIDSKSIICYRCAGSSPARGTRYPAAVVELVDTQR